MKNVQRIFLKNGHPVSQRPLQASDVDLLEEMHEQLSEQTLYNRYLRPHAPSRAELEQICDLAPDRGSAFIALMENPGQQAIGMGYYLLDGHNSDGVISAEPAIVISDLFQGKGLGSSMFKHLCEDAARRGVGEFACYLHVANEACLKLIRRSGYSYHGQYAYGTREIYIDLSTERVVW